MSIIISSQILCDVLHFNYEHSQIINFNKIFNYLKSLKSGYELADDIFMPFKNLKTININGLSITKMPQIPDTVIELIVTKCAGITALPVLPSKLEYLSCSKNSLTSLPEVLPDTLGQINCDHNKLAYLPKLNATRLVNLYCQRNCLKEIGTLPASLKRLHCYNNELQKIPALPPGLQELKCLYNPLVTYPYFTNEYIYKYFEVPVLPAYTDIIKQYPFQNPTTRIAYNEEQNHDKAVIDMDFFKKINNCTLSYMISV